MVEKRTKINKKEAGVGQFLKIPRCISGQKFSRVKLLVAYSVNVCVAL